MKTLLAALVLVLRADSTLAHMIRLDLSVGSGVHGGLGIGEKAVAQRNRVR